MASVTPVAGLTSEVLLGGTAVVVIPPNANGGVITNPYAASDQGLENAEVLYIDPTGAAADLSANGTAFALQPGQEWTIIPGQTTSTSVNAASSGHKFSAIYY